MIAAAKCGRAAEGSPTRSCCGLATCPPLRPGVPTPGARSRAGYRPGPLRRSGYRHRWPRCGPRRDATGTPAASGDPRRWRPGTAAPQRGSACCAARSSGTYNRTPAARKVQVARNHECPRRRPLPVIDRDAVTGHLIALPAPLPDNQAVELCEARNPQVAAQPTHGEQTPPRVDTETQAPYQPFRR